MVQSKMHLQILNSAVYVSFISYIVQNKQNCWDFQISVDWRSMYAGKRKRENEGLDKSVIYCFSDVIFSEAHARETGDQKNWSTLLT